MKRERNDGQVIPARRRCSTFVNRWVRTNVAMYRPICGYIFQSAWQCQLVDTRIIIKRFFVSIG